MKKEEIHYGLTRAQWLKLYEDGEWKSQLVKACVDIATCSHAAPKDRDNALAIVGALTREGMLSESDWTAERSLPEMIRDVQLAILVGRPMTLDQAKRDYCAERMHGVRMVAEMVHSLMHPHHAVDDAIVALIGPPPVPTGQEN